MRFLYLNIIILLAAINIASAGENFDGIYRKNLEARGGSQVVKSAVTYIIEGELRREDSIKFNFRAAYKRPKSIVVEYYQEGDTSALGFDGKLAWTLWPSVSRNVITLPESAANEAISLTVKPVIDYFNRLDYYKSIKADVEVTDRDTLDSIPQFRLVCPDNNGEAEIICVNKTDNLISQINTNMTVGGKSIPVTISLGDYRKCDGGGLVFPHHIKISNGANAVAELNVTLFELNPELSDIIFEIPK